MVVRVGFGPQGDHCDPSSEADAGRAAASRNAQNTVRAYIFAIEDFAKYFHRSPDHLGPEHIREYQVHLFRDCKLSAGTIEGRSAALRFLFVKTLRRPFSGSTKSACQP